MRTGESHENIVELSVIREKKQRALSPFGPVRVGLTTSPALEMERASQLARLSELLSSLENVVDSLNYKSFTAYATLANATEALRAVVYDTVLLEDGTDEQGV